MVNGWKKLRSRKSNTGTSVVYKKNELFLEIFQDSSWIKKDYKKTQANVTIYNHDVQSYMSSFGRPFHTEYLDNISQAEKWANRYMKIN